jgi:uncharacterized protein YeaO (DUF488 family)
MPLKTRRWCDPAAPDDGLRVLVCRYRPRGLPKADETWDVWYPELGPSKELHAAFYGKDTAPITLDAYRERYLVEMRESKPTSRIAELAERAKTETVTLLCSKTCIIPPACHRTLLRELIEAGIRSP